MFDEAGEEIPDWVLVQVSSALRLVVGLAVLDDDDPLHQRMVHTMLRLGSNAVFADRLTALRFDVAWELRATATAGARGKANYEQAVGLRVLALVEAERIKGRRLGVSTARLQAETERFSDRLAFVEAEARASSCRKLLDAMESAMNAHRTDRADARAGDRAHAAGYGDHS